MFPVGITYFYKLPMWQRIQGYRQYMIWWHLCSTHQHGQDEFTLLKRCRYFRSDPIVVHIDSPSAPFIASGAQPVGTDYGDNSVGVVKGLLDLFWPFSSELDR